MAEPYAHPANPGQGRLLLIGEPGAALDVAAGMARDPGAELSVTGVNPAALDRLQQSGRPLVMVDLSVDLDQLLTRLNADDHAAAPAVGELVGRTVAEVERDLILQTLARCHGNRTSASTVLGISVRTMRNKLRGFVQDGIAIAPAH
jgi:DNA-binding protein Fis